MELGVFIPIGNNGWLISTTSPQYRPSFDLNREIVAKAERFGFDFAGMLDELAAVPAVRGVMLTFDDFVIGMEQFGSRILPLLKCRGETRRAA
jgi:hypothetical protein